MQCVNHPKRETNVSCAECGSPLCPDCMVYAPVGIKCKQCATLPKSARLGIKPRYILQAIGAGLGAAIIGGVLLGEITKMIHFGSLLLSIALGYGIGEAVSWGARRNRGLTLQIVAGLCALMAFGIGNLYSGFNPIRSLFDLIGVGVAVYRLKD